jgi:ABC-type branched-subunit amino acid transport system substrate-binding protein
MKRCIVVMVLACTVMLSAFFINIDRGICFEKPDVFVLPISADVTGPYAPITQPIITNFREAVEWYNQNKGGIDGVPIKVDFTDTGGKTQVAVAAYERWRVMEPKPVLVYPFSSADCSALKPRLKEDQIVGLTCAPPESSIYPAGWLFSNLPTYGDQFGLFIDWLVDTWVPKSGQKPKLAFLTWDSEFGRAASSPACIEYAKKKGVQVVAEEFFGVRDADVSTHLIRIKSKGANWVYTNTLGNGPAVILKSAKAMGLIGSLNFGGGPWTIDMSSIRLSEGLMEGWIGPFNYACWSETDNPGIQLLEKQFKLHNRKPIEKTISYVYAYNELFQGMAAVTNAVRKVGWEKLDGEAVKTELSKMKNFNLFGLNDITYKPGRVTPLMSRITEVKNGQIVPITKYLECPELTYNAYK